MLHTTYDLISMHALALSNGHDLEVTKYVLSMDPCISVGIGLQAWSVVISEVGAADVAMGPVMAGMDTNNQNTLMMASALMRRDRWFVKSQSCVVNVRSWGSRVLQLVL